MGYSNRRDGLESELTQACVVQTTSCGLSSIAHAQDASRLRSGQLSRPVEDTFTEKVMLLNKLVQILFARLCFDAQLGERFLQHKAQLQFRSCARYPPRTTNRGQNSSE